MLRFLVGGTIKIPSCIITVVWTSADWESCPDALKVEHGHAGDDRYLTIEHVRLMKLLFPILCFRFYTPHRGLKYLTEATPQ